MRCFDDFTVIGLKRKKSNIFVTLKARIKWKFKFLNKFGALFLIDRNPEKCMMQLQKSFDAIVLASFSPYARQLSTSKSTKL